MPDDVQYNDNEIIFESPADVTQSQYSDDGDNVDDDDKENANPVSPDDGDKSSEYSNTVMSCLIHLPKKILLIRIYDFRHLPVIRREVEATCQNLRQHMLLQFRK